MRFYKKLSLCLLLLAASICAFAGSGRLTVDYAEISVFQDYYMLNANFITEIDPVLEEAINKGVPISFLVEFQIVKPRKYWFDDEIITSTKRINVSYHALTRQYLVAKDDAQKSFSTLKEAIQDLAELRNWKVVETKQLDATNLYQASILIRLDKTKLPKALQVDAISSEDWNVASPVYTWSLTEIQ